MFKLCFLNVLLQFLLQCKFIKTEYLMSLDSIDKSKFKWYYKNIIAYVIGFKITINMHQKLKLNIY